MKALRFSKFGPPSVLQIEDVARPEPHAGEVLIQVKAAAINPSDVKNVAGQFHSTLPRTPGRDFAGIVEEGNRFKGEPVWSSAPGFGITRDGSQAEFVVVPDECLALVPRGLSMGQASAIGVPFITGWVALMRAAQVQAGEIILIIGAAGAVGQAATQIAVWKGARVLGGTINSDSLEGVDALIDTTLGDLREQVFALTNGRGADVVFDTVGGAMFEPGIRSLRVGGRQVAITSTGERRVSFDLVDFYHNELRLIGVDTMKLTAADVGSIATELRAGFESGALRVPPIKSIPFDQAIEAYNELAAGRAPTKCVLTFP